VANLGGSLTPLGDPPLFLGFLHNVPFFWVTTAILPHMLLASLILLVLFFAVDTFYYNKEKDELKKIGPMEQVPIRIQGMHNFIFLAGIVILVLISGYWKAGHFNVMGIHMTYQNLLRDVGIIVMGTLSLLLTSKSLREENEFSWFPIMEVAKLFAGIFMTIIPCLAILKAGSNGAMAGFIAVVKEPFHYFWVTGALSGFLDNAPTYLTFFNTALGAFYSGMSEPQAVPLLMTESSVYLKAISAGAVFFGSFSYIGNAPNFMVRSIAEEAGTPMPSFFGYILKFSIIFLLPTFLIVTFIFF